MVRRLLGCARCWAKVLAVLSPMIIVGAGCESKPDLDLSSASLSTEDIAALPLPPPIGSKRARGSEVALILPTTAAIDAMYWDQVARMEIGRAKRIFSLLKEEPSDRARSLPGLVRQVTRGDMAGAILVVPEAKSVTPELLSALKEAQAAGVKFVVLGGELPGGPEAEALMLPSVVYGPFEAVAEQLVKAAVSEAARLKLSATGPVLLMLNDEVDSQAQNRRAALRKALAAAKLDKVHDVHFLTDGDSARGALKKALQEHPDASIVLTDDDTGLSSSEVIHLDGSMTSKFVVGGFITQESNMNFPDTGQSVGIVHYHVQRLAARAVQLLISQIEGSGVPPVTVVSPEFRRGAEIPLDMRLNPETMKKLRERGR